MSKLPKFVGECSPERQATSGLVILGNGYFYNKEFWGFQRFQASGDNLSSYERISSIFKWLGEKG